MTPKARNLVLALVGLAIIAVIVIPRLNTNQNIETERQPQQQTNQSQGQETAFRTTANPADVYQQALADDKPIMVEFYADW